MNTATARLKRLLHEWWICPKCGMGYAGYFLNTDGRCGDLSQGQLEPCNGILALTQKGERYMSQSVVRLHRNDKSSALSTNAATEEEFVREAVAAIVAEIGLPGATPEGPADQGSIDMLYRVIPQIIDIACKLRGYKANVTEHRVIVAGQFVPDDVVDAFGYWNGRSKELAATAS